MLGLTAIVLAAGQGKRMRSAKPKVLHEIAGRPLVHFPVAAAVGAGAERIVVVASPATRDAIRQALSAQLGEDRLCTVVQDPPLGTGDAARVGLDSVQTERVLILYGDTPLVEADDVQKLVRTQRESATADLVLLSCVVDDPGGYGRVLRDAVGRVIEVREDRDLGTDAERAIREVNAGMYATRTATLREALRQVRPANAQGEYYLTDVVALAARGAGVEAVVGGEHNLVGVNDRAQLATAESAMYQRIAQRHARAGVTIRGDVRIDDPVIIEPDAVVCERSSLRGLCRIGARARVDVGCVLTNVQLEDDVALEPYCVLSGCHIGPGARVGPFAHLEAGTHVARGHTASATQPT